MGDSEIAELDNPLRPGMPPLDIHSPPPNFPNGVPRLYVGLTCPYAQRVWIARNFKGLYNIEIVPINVSSRPAWYTQRISPSGKVPILEHNGKIISESLEILQYMDTNFDGPPLFPMASSKRNAARELLKYIEAFSQQAFTILRNKETSKIQLDRTIGTNFDHLEASLGIFSIDGPFFLGSISAVDFAYVPFVERYVILFQELSNYNILQGHPNLLRWLAALNQLDAYKSTKPSKWIVVNEMKKNLL